MLKDRRTTLKLPTYDVAQKKLIIEQARLVMGDLYVHRDMKLNSFGKQIDPLPKLDALEKVAEGMSDYDFHDKMIKIFNSQRDLHTVYELPRPYGCYRNMLPFSVNEIEKGQTSKFVVSALIDNPEFLALLPNKLNIAIGDELVSYDGKSLDQLYKEMAPLNNGANSDATRRFFLEDLSYKIQTISLMPENNEVALEFKKQNGTRIKTIVPWVNRGRLSCLKNYPEKILGRSKFQDEFNKLYQREGEENTTEEPIVTWRMLENNYGKFAILKLTNFIPEKLYYPKTILLIEKLMRNEFAGTTGLIIDMRNNPGGWIPFGEMMLQLFGPAENNLRMKFSFNVNPSNLFLISNFFINSNMSESYYQALERQEKLSVPLVLTPEGQMNMAKPAYFKPVAIFTNANCYSTCDMFSAQMQDHGYALIVGEDTTTGAGGANYQTHRTIYDKLKAENVGPFKELPHNQEMSFSWRQAYRINGDLIENVGVKSDVVIPTTLNDIMFKSRDQFLEISKILSTR